MKNVNDLVRDLRMLQHIYTRDKAAIDAGETLPYASNHAAFDLYFQSQWETYKTAVLVWAERLGVTIPTWTNPDSLQSIVDALETAALKAEMNPHAVIEALRRK